MQGKFLPVALFALLACSADGAGSQPVVAYTFVCNGSPTRGIGACPDGASPGSLIQGSDGNFYGAAKVSSYQSGGLPVNGGTVFSLTPAGKFTLLHTFAQGANKNFANGEGPASLIEGPDGNLYGATASGGKGYDDPPGFFGYGIVFRIGKTGSGFQVIHRFCSVMPSCSDGAYPAGGLVAGTDGNIYGVTSQGGTGSGCPQPACGTIFRVTPSSGAYQVVFSFSASTGQEPTGLTLAPDGTIYGLTLQGGVLFHYTPATGALQSMALRFPFPSGCSGFACFATSGPVFGPNGYLYGLYTVYQTGGSGLFEVQPDGGNLQLFPQYATAAEGGSAVGLLLASDGNFWVTESDSATGVSGAIVTLSPSDGTAIQTLTPFGGAAGSYPSALIQAKDGTLWGEAAGGVVAGSDHFAGGTVFSLNEGLPPH